MDEEQLLSLVRLTAADDALTALASTANAMSELERLATVAVRRARNQGASWTQIAAAMGVSKQAVHKKYGGARFFGAQP